jgi:glycosyltransferase involved in cell wall biosynthesis
MISPKVSVIIPCYNHAQFILEALESVINQTFNDFQCLIIDDGSTDNTKQIVLDWIKTDGRFKYYYQDNSGLSKARNYGISLSLGSYILPLDSDDKISDNYIEKCVIALNANSEIKIAYGEAYFFGNSKKKWNLDTYNFEDILYKNMIYCTGLFRKQDWERVGGYDENLKKGLEDWEFWIHILKNGGEVIKLNNCFFYYRLKDNSMIIDAVINNSYGYNSRLYIFEKHIDVYRKTNFYDMYFENYKLKKAIANPLLFFTVKKLFFLLIKAIIKELLFLKKRIFLKATKFFK